jgi:hypothetical protein
VLYFVFANLSSLLFSPFSTDLCLFGVVWDVVVFDVVIHHVLLHVVHPWPYSLSFLPPLLGLAALLSAP